MSQEPIILEDGDVLSVTDEYRLMRMETMFRKDQFEKQVTRQFINYSSTSETKWIREGAKCDALIMKAGKWIKGKVKFKVVLEFYPDEPLDDEAPDSPKPASSESPLDDIRQSLQQA
jgi:hypothetical protein